MPISCHRPCKLKVSLFIASFINGKVAKFSIEVNTVFFSKYLSFSFLDQFEGIFSKRGRNISSQDATKLLSLYKLGLFPEKYSKLE